MADLRLRRSAADRLLIHAQTLTEPRWTPLPHQVPPPPGFFGWLLMAGRGAGKTDACARYVHEHVYGPPCLPGPVPHWIGIIAPTLGDAATSCYAGPSGLRVHSPEAKMTTVQGGTVIRWPNGSEAKIFGAHSPEDVERLRSGGNRSLSGSTLIRTERGNVPIRDVEPGDWVWTRNGLRRVLAVHDHDVKPLWSVELTDGRVLRGTADHKVWTGRTWSRIDQLRSGGTVSTWPQITSYTTASVGTTKTMTGPTMTSPTSWRSTPGNTREPTPGETSSDRTARQAQSRPPSNGATYPGNHDLSVVPSVAIAADGSRTFTRTLATVMRTYAGKAGLRTGRARSAVHYSRWSPAAMLSSAASHAGERFDGVVGPIERHTLNGCASCAGHSSPGTPGAKPALAPVRVRSVHPLLSEKNGMVTKGRVYDLTVEHDHEFFANDVLVANCLNWLEELAAWRYLDDTWDQMRFGLRTGPRPHWVASTTPKPRARIKKLSSGGVQNVVVTRATTYDNPHLPEDIRAALEDAYGGTQLGRQELYAEVIDQDENALWNRAMLDATRVRPGEVPHLVKKTVGVDPSGGRGEQGIVVVGKALLPREHEDVRKRVELAHGFVIADRTCHLSPDGWGRRAVQAAVDYEADDICVEVNFGGDMALNTIRAAADALGVPVPIRTARATRGKKVRAEPVSALTEQGRWHMAGSFPELEDQMCEWYPELDWSPDRLDAMVWPAWHLRIVKAAMTGNATSGGLAAASRPIG